MKFKYIIEFSKNYIIEASNEEAAIKLAEEHDTQEYDYFTINMYHGSNPPQIKEMDKHHDEEK